MIPRLRNFAWTAVFWTALAAMAVAGLAVGFDLRPNWLVMVATGVTFSFIVGYCCWHDFHVMRATLWSWRYRWWARRMGRFSALQDERRSRGLCPSCGYDLTGNVSGTCPECGSSALTR
jgi:hypothetical protein